MARPALPAWLRESIEGDILLAIHWLQRIASSEAQTKVEEGESWAPIYQDYGSYLEFKPCDDSHRLLQIIGVEKSPLVFTLSDGQAFIEATLTPACARDVRQRHPGLDLARDTLHSLFTIRRSRLRCATNGPRSSRLRLALVSVDWTRGPYHEQVSYPEPLVSLFNEKIRQLVALRARQALKYVYADPAATPDAHRHAMSRTPASMSQSFATQLPNFGQDHDDDSQDRALISRSGQHETYGEDQSGPERGKVPDPVKKLLHILVPRPPEDEPRSGQSVPVAHNADDQLSGDSDHPLRGGRSPMASSAQPLDHTISPPHESGPSTTSKHDTSFAMAQAGWMRMYVFDEAATSIPDRQRTCLSRPEAWQKPPPGVRAVSGNIPIEDLKRIQAVREDNSLKISDPSQGTSLQLTQGSCLQDESTTQESGFGAEHGAVAHTILEEDDSSQAIPWSSSPPEAPRPVHGPPSLPSHQGLPPDSSCEPAHHFPDSSIPGFSSTHRITQDDARFQPGQNNGYEDNNAHHVITPTVVAEEDDDDMEISIPRALGEDFKPLPMPFITKRTDPNDDLQRTARSLLKSTVQVEETPYAKQKSEARKASVQRAPSQPVQRSSDASDEIEIVYGTYKEATSSTESTTKRPSSTGAVLLGDSLTVAVTAAEDRIDATLGFPGADSSSKRKESMSAPSSKRKKRRKLKQLKFDSEDSADAGNVSDEYRRDRARCLGQHQDPPPEGTAINEPQGGNAVNQTDPTIGVDARVVPTKDSAQLLENARQQSFVTLVTSPKLPKRERVEAVMTGSTEHAQNTIPKVLEKSSSINDQSQSTVTDNRPSTQSLLAVPPRLGSFTGRVQSAQADNESGGRSPRNSASNGSSSTVFTHFQRIYPDYAGDETHFASLCRRIYARLEGGSPLPQCHWDDYVIRHCGLYGDYVKTCLRRGEERKPYHEWYADQKDGPVYTRVLGNKETIKQALDEILTAHGAQVSGLSTTQQNAAFSTLGPLSAPTSDTETRSSHHEHPKSTREVDNSRFESNPKTDLPFQERSKTTGMGRERSSLPAASQIRIPSNQNHHFEAKNKLRRSTNSLIHLRKPHERDKELSITSRPLPEPGFSRRGKASTRHSMSDISASRAERARNLDVTPSHRTSLSAVPQTIATAATPSSNTVIAADEEDPWSARANAIFGFQGLTSFRGSSETPDRWHRWPLTLGVMPAMPERKAPNVLEWHDAL